MFMLTLRGLRAASGDASPNSGALVQFKTAVAVVALAVFAASGAHAQDAAPAEAPPAEAVEPAAPAPEIAPVKEPVLPEVQVETADDAPEAAAKAPVKAAPQPAQGMAKPRKTAKPRATPAPEPVVATESAFDTAPAADFEADGGAGSGEAAGPAPVRGGPSGIDGYIAKNTSTATKTDTPIMDIPQSITVITRQQADDQGSRSLGQALTYVPGVTVAQGEGHRDALTIRGQQTTADFYLNGVRDDVEYYRDLYNIEAVEVLKGPSAMVFGRGGGGGVVNRTQKEADGERVREVTATYGSYDTKRTTIDVGDAISSAAAFRLNAMYEDSEGFRDFFELERFGINPTMGFKLTDQTKLLVSYEFYSDERTVDRGVPSRDGRPSRGDRETFFGNPDDSAADFEGHTAAVTLEHKFTDDVKVRNHTSYMAADKVYANTFASSAVSDAGTVDISGYRDATQRDSIINQTDLTMRFTIAPGIRHTILAGTEFLHQETTNNRDNARFLTPDGAGSITVPFANPTLFSDVFYNDIARRRATELDTQSAYVQDQLEISRYVELIGGIRFDRFDIDFEDRRVGHEDDRFSRVDNVWSPRGGVVFKPSEQISIYVSYSKSFLPSAGDQFNVLDVTAETLEPQEFENRELGFKAELLPRLLFTGALFQLDRTNQVVASGPFAGTQVGETRTEGGELSLTGYITDQWEISAGFGHQIALVTEGDGAGSEVPWVPHNTFSLWNRYQFTPMWGAGIGVLHRTDFYAALNNEVQVPGYTRVDAALFFNLNDQWKAQLNVENILGEDYFVSAHNNNNIMPGAPTSVYLTVGAQF
jgi:catecholate siderophore receptor